tara:strand:+ start:726 stop:1811 length:1086 start_codon:yes stop_codon:yes gene_type:complete
MSIHVIQPVVPHYRVPFFSKLASVNSDIHFYASEKDDIDVVSVNDEVFSYIKLGKIISLFGFSWQLGITKILLKLKSKDIMVINGNPRYLSTLFIALIARLIGVKIVWWGQGWSANTTTNSFRLRAYLMRFADAVLLYTDDEKTLLHPYVSEKKLYALNNGIENKYICKYAEVYDPKSRPKAIIFIGRLTDKSNLQVLLKAISVLKDSTCLHVIGAGPNSELYKAEAHALGITDKVIFHGELLSEEDIARVANQSKVFVYPGNVGLSLIHAFNYGLPAVIHSDKSRHMPEASCHIPQSTGKVFEYGNYISLSNIICKIINDDDMLSFYSLECKNIVKDNYNIDSMCLRFQEVITSVQHGKS